MTIRRVFAFAFLLLVGEAKAQFEGQRFTLSVFSNTGYVCETWVQSSKPQQLTFDLEREPLLECLAKEIKPDILKTLAKAWKSSDRLTVEDLQREGISSKIDLQFYRLDISIPSDWRIAQSVSVMRSAEDDRIQNVNSSTFSSYVNYSVNKSLGGSQATQSTVLLNPVVGWKDTIFESFHQIDQGNRLERVETRISHDFESLMVRAIAGDQYTRQTPLMSPMRFAGLTVNREFAISPGFINRPLGAREIFLDQPSRVDIFVNGVLFRTLNLEAGKHSIEDIPINKGINNVTLRVTDPNGQQRLIQFQSSTEESLLKQGLSDYSFQVGQATEASSLTPRYGNTTVGSALYRYGITTQWTSGGFGQFADSGLIAGIENTLAFPIGIFRLQNAFSNNQADTGSESGYAARTEYVWSCPCSFAGRNQRFAIGGEWYSPQYLVGVYPLSYAINRNRWSLFSNMSSTIADGLAGQIYGTYNQGYVIHQRSIVMGLDINKILSQDASLNVSYQHERPFSGIMGHTLSLQLLIQFNGGRGTVLDTARIGTGVKSNRTDLFYNQLKPANNLITQGYVDVNDLTHSAGARTNFGWQYADLNGGVDYLGATKETRFNLNPAGSLVFTDGTFGVGRPIRDSFILIQNNHIREVIVNGTESEYEAKIPSGFSSVLTGTQSYQKKSIHVADLGSQRNEFGLSQDYLTRPTYKMGTVIRIQKDSVYSLRARIVDESGKPIAIAAGKFVNDQGSREFSFFTGYEGEIFLEQVKPGRYIGTIYGRPFEEVELVIGELIDGVNDAGTLKSKKRNQQPSGR